jgi:hypothetical protein
MTHADPHALTTFKRVPAFALSTLVAALLGACGGGGDSAASATVAAIDDPTATLYAADATQIDSDAFTTADSAVLAAQALIGAGAGVSSVGGHATVESAGLSPEVSSTRACPGGGTVTVSITGGTTASQLNGKLDAGEVYAVAFAACSGAAGIGQLDGSMAMTVLSASGDSANGALSVSLTATRLALALPRGGATLDGSVTRSFSVSTAGDGSVHLTSHYATPSLTLATHYNARSSSFVLSNADITRTATLVGGVLQSSGVDGTHTIAATLPNTSFGYTVSTTGGATYAADGTPTAGLWTITLPNTTITVTIAGTTATVALDRGKDGTIDRSFTVPVAQLVAQAG